jgi:hypothetical protein
MNAVFPTLFDSMKINSKAKTFRLLTATRGSLTTRWLFAVLFVLSNVPDRSLIDELSPNGCRHDDFTHSLKGQL